LPALHAAVARARRPAGHALAVTPVELPAGKPGLFHWTVIAYQDQEFGWVGLVRGDQPAGEPAEFLVEVARELGLHAYLHGLEQEAAELRGQAEVGEAFGVFMHELGNALNNLILDISLLARQAPAGAAERIEQIRRSGFQIAETARQIHAYRAGRRSPGYPVDLNQVIRQVVQEPDLRDALPKVELGKDLPAVSGAASACKHLVRFLLNHAIAVVDRRPGQVSVRTSEDGAQVVLAIEDHGPAVPAEWLPQLFEPFVTVREGGNSIELAVCQSLAKRLQASIEVAAQAEGGLRWLVRFPCLTIDASGVADGTGPDH
jgi:signal transduction histidine kinase